ncbi:MAG TPA: adenylyl-sulfate kinase [Dongiaceae bacterium]|nr:adenylyl-sulfate kinase [Dongiaceae bacterium]
MDGTAYALELTPNATSIALAERFPFAIVGHVDHGKSSLIGRLLHDTNALPEGKFAELKAASDKRGGQFEWSFLLDALQAERDQGITIDTTQIFFSTPRRRYVIIDAPGHKEFLKNAISGVAQAQAAILVIDAAEGVREQTHRHALILQLLGLRQIAVAVNKTDLIGYDRARFDAIAREITEYLRQLKLTPSAIVPVSARHGDNIAAPSANMPWHKGPTVLEVLDSFVAAPVATDQPLRLPIQDVFKFDERRLVVGRIESGSLRVGDRLEFAPGFRQAKVASIEAWNASTPFVASAGQSIAITLDDELFIERGHVAVHSDRRPVLGHRADLRLFWLDDHPLKIGDRLKLRIATAEYPVEVERIAAIIDVERLQPIQAIQVGRNAIAEITVRSRALMALDRAADMERTGRGVLLRDGEIVGGALVLNAEASDVDKRLIAPDHLVSRDAREAVNGHRGAVLWLTGLSGSGKSTLAMGLERLLFQRGRQAFVLDGDLLRQGATSDLGFSPEDRAENIRRSAEVAKLLADAGQVVIVSLISPYAADRDRARKIIGERFHEIHVKADLATCESRDPKGLYKAARSGAIKGFTGVDAPYEAPARAELVIDTAGQPMERSLAALSAYVEPAIALQAVKDAWAI